MSTAGNNQNLWDTLATADTIFECPKCHQIVEYEWDYCPYCGAYLKGIRVTSNV